MAEVTTRSRDLESKERSGMAGDGCGLFFASINPLPCIFFLPSCSHCSSAILLDLFLLSYLFIDSVPSGMRCRRMTARGKRMAVKKQQILTRETAGPGTTSVPFRCLWAGSQRCRSRNVKDRILIWKIPVLIGARFAPSKQEINRSRQCLFAFLLTFVIQLKE